MSNSYSIELPNGISSSADSAGEATALDFKSLIGIIYRRFWLIALGFLTTFLLVAYVTFTQTPLYKATTTVQLDTSQRNVIDISSVLGGIAANTAEIDTEVLVMGSKSLMARVATKEKLIEDPEFNWTLREKKVSLLSNIKSGVMGLLGKDTAEEDPFAGMSDAERQRSIEESVVSALIAKTSIKRVGTTYLITAIVTSENPETAARLADAIADQYRVNQMDQKLEATRRATSWLNDRVAVLADEVQEKEMAVAQYMADNDINTVNGETQSGTELIYLQSQLTQLRVDYQAAQARYDNMQRQMRNGAVDSIPEVLGSQVVNDLKSQRAIIRRSLVELESRLADRHPELIAARSESADIDRQINAEIQRIAGNLQNEVTVARRRMNDVQGNINTANAQLNTNQAAMVPLKELQRDADTSRELLESFISRSKQTGVQDSLVEPDASILSSATIPNAPSTPKTLLNLLLGIVLGTVLGGSLALLSEMFDSKISSSEDVERKLKSNPIGSVPMIRTQGLLGLGSIRPSDHLIDNPLSAYAESIRYLRAAIAFSDLDSETKTVAITSSLPDEGKTSLTLSLGRMSAMSGSRTLVIDGDFRRRQLTEAAGLSPEIGFVEHLFGAGELTDAITKDSKSLLDILPLSRSGHTPHDVFGTRAFDDMMDRLRPMYDLILIDTGPLLLMAEARVVAGKADKAILVVRWRHSTRSAVNQSLKLLRTFKADLLGVTLNMVDLTRRRHHRDPGATYKAYRKYYTMETKPGLFGFKKKKNQDKVHPGLRPMANPIPSSPVRAANEQDDVDPRAAE
ncbi:MAG: GumC family protein [Hyphomonas sp.]